ncbi:hypothetical protein CH302_00930 [Rhodococcus sp. 15-2388-1-1a]|uniref:hypothetical protein n=1 Tax=Nocardiaceae TaxID=85025 RepID=UPI0005670235|nr:MULTISPECIES: hypothetical protein [Rhodococcus]OZF05219.1 hypothetical protein CH302_00930 [Rhodococcus sp. 15-2388-1-1a]
MSAVAEIVRKLADALGAIESPPNYGPWRVVSADRWEQSAGQGWATGYIEIIAPDDGEFSPAEQLYFAAEPDKIPAPEFDTGMAADHARDLAIDREVLS